MRFLLPSTLTLHFKRFGPIPVSLNPTDVTHLQVLEEFIYHEAYPLELIPFTPDLVIDCGAHIGLFLRLCRSRFERTPLIGFEPQHKHALFARRAASAPHLILHEAAVGLQDGVVTFSPSAFSGYGAVDGGTVAARDHHTIEVPQISLPNVLSQTAAQQLLLKIDIEGGERELLPAIIDLIPSRCALFMETHHGEPAWEDAAARLSGAGFTVQRMRSLNGCIDGYFLRE